MDENKVYALKVTGTSFRIYCYRKGEYEARSFLNRITAIDEVAEVQKELSKAEIIKTGAYEELPTMERIIYHRQLPPLTEGTHSLSTTPLDE